MSTQLAFDILARDRGASSTFDRVGNRVDATSSKFHRLGTAVKYAALGLAGGVVIAGRAALEFAQGAADDERAAKGLALQMHNSADATRGQVKATEEWISKQGVALGVTDDDLRPALARMVAVTHDVAKARRDVALAENVSAGTGKNLTTVTSALAKAQLGSLSGLSRLGVKTKDAAGKTLTLRQVTKSLAQTYSGQAAKAADTASGRYGRLKVMLSETGEAIGYKLLPPMTKVAGWILDKGVPGLSRLSEWLQKNTGDVAKTATTLGRDLLPVLKQAGIMLVDVGTSVMDAAGPILHDLLPAAAGLAGTVADLVGWLDDLPDPMKHIAIEAGLAALVVPRLAAAVTGATGAVTGNIARLQQWRVEMSSAETRSGALASATQRLGTAARTAGGIGGMVLLAQGASQADSSLGFLEKTAGGALTGFSAGGPWGAAIGLGAGAIWGLASATSASAVEMVQAKGINQAYADSLDQVTGATTRQTRAMVYDNLMKNETSALLLRNIQASGIATRDVVGAVMGEEGARHRIVAAMRDQNAEYDRLKEKFGYNSEQAEGSRKAAAALHQLLPFIKSERLELDASQKATRRKAAAVQTWNEALRGLPPEAKTELKQLGYQASMKQVRALGREYDLTPKQVKTVIRALGVSQVKKDADGAKRSLDDVGKAKANLDPWKRGLLSALSDGKSTAERGGKSVQKSLEAGPKNAKADLSALLGGITSGTNRAKGIASSGGKAVGSNLQSGIMAGFAGTEAQLSAQAAAAVRGAVAAARHAGDIHSPSRKMAEVGEFLGDGAVLGLRSRLGAARDAGTEFMVGIADGVAEGQKTLQGRLDRATQTLSDWRSKLQGLMSDKSSFVSGFQSFTSSLFGSVTGPTVTGADGAETTLPPSVAQILGYQKNERAKAANLDGEVRTLLGLGLSKSLIRQLQDQGPSGLAQIHALATGASRADIAELNSLNKQTADHLRSAGTAGAHALFAGDIRNARQHVEVAIDEVKLAKALVKAQEKRDKERQRKDDAKSHAEAADRKALTNTLAGLAPAIGQAVGDELNGTAGRAARRRQHT